MAYRWRRVFSFSLFLLLEFLRNSWMRRYLSKYSSPNLQLCLRIFSLRALPPTYFSKTLFYFAKTLFFLWIEQGCGDKPILPCRVSSTSMCQKESEDSKAVRALNNGQFDLAIALLEPLVSDSPTEYERYPRLACAYAGKAGIDLFAIASKQLNGKTSTESSNVFARLTQFLPDPDAESGSVYKTRIETLDTAKNLLLRMPTEQRQTSVTYYYGYSAEMQLSLYGNAASLMRVMRFAPMGRDTASDATKLKNMTPEDAVDILQNLRQNAGSQTDPILGEKIQNMISQIDGSPGATDQEKLQNFLASKK